MKKLIRKHSRQIALLVLIPMALVVVTPAITPAPAQASALIPASCDLYLDNPTNWGFKIVCYFQLQYDCCDPIGDGWLDD